MQIKTVMVPVEQYEVEGTIYKTWQEAESAQRRLEEDRNPILKFQRTYSWKGLVGSGYNLDSVGYFVIMDEGPVDYGSSGSPRVLAYVHGQLRDVILKAFNTKGFMGYGPGNIKPFEIEEV